MLRISSLVLLGVAAGCAPLAGMTPPDGGPVPGTTAVASAAARVGGRDVLAIYPRSEFDRRATRVLVLNDGQDLGSLRVFEALEAQWAAGPTEPFIVLAVPTVDRLQEYGTSENGVSIACIPSAGSAPLGTTAAAYARWVTTELLPWAAGAFGMTLEPARTGTLGASLGGLSAVSLAHDNPGVFGFAGAMSGSFWWRTTPGTVAERQASRIMHAIIARGAPRPGLRLWLEAGTKDETDDRDGDGIIDAIDDTLDLVEVATPKVKSVTYVEVVDGTHGYTTWAPLFPDVLRWAAEE